MCPFRVVLLLGLLIAGTQAAIIPVYSTGAGAVITDYAINNLPPLSSGHAFSSLSSASQAATTDRQADFSNWQSLMTPSTNIPLAFLYAQRSEALIFTQPSIPSVILDESADLLSTTSAHGAFYGYKMVPENSAWVAAVIELVQHFGWQDFALIHSDRHSQVATLFSAAAEMANINVPLIIAHDESHPESTAYTIAKLESSSVRVAVVLGDEDAFELIINRKLESSIEFIWANPGSARPSVPKLATSKVQAPFFAVDLDFANSTVISNLEASVGTSILSPYAVDALTAWRSGFEDAVANSGSPDNATDVFARSLSTRPYGITGRLEFENDGKRVGTFAVWNFVKASSSWTRAGTISSVDGVSLNSGVVFSDGKLDVPESSYGNIINIGCILPTSGAIAGQFRSVAQLAVEEINNGTSILPNHTVRFFFHDDKRVAGVAIAGAVSQVERGVIAVVGSGRSGVSQGLQYYLSASDVPQVSPASTADLFSDKAQYPTFFRTVPADRLQGSTMAAFVKDSGWSRVCIINYLDEYASNIATQFIAQATALDITIITRVTYALTADTVTSQIENLASARCRIIVGIVEFASLTKVFTAAKQAGLLGPTGATWILSEVILNEITRPTLAARNLTTSDFTGMFITAPSLAPQNWAPYDKFRARVVGANPTLYPGAGAEPVTFTTFIHDAFFAIATAADAVLQKGLLPSNRTALRSELYRVDFEGASGRVRFDANGDRTGASYSIFNYNDAVGTPQVTATWVDGTGIARIAPYVFPDGTSTFPPDMIALPIRTVSYLDAIPLIIITAILMLIVLGTVAIVVRYWTNPLIRRSSPVFLLVIIFGVVLAMISNFMWFGDLSPEKCHLRVWLGFVGCAIAYSALLSKNWRLWYLFNEPSLRVIAITNKTLFSVMAGGLAPLIIILIVWSAVGPFQVGLLTSAAGDFNYQVCQGSIDHIMAPIAFVYSGILLLMGGVLSFKTRTLPDIFKESQYIALATYNGIFVAVICIVLGYVISYEPRATFFISTVGILVGTFGEYALLFWPKVYIVRWRPTDVEAMTPSKGRTTGPSSGSIQLSNISSSK